MNTQTNLAKKAMVYDLFISVVVGTAFALGTALMENNNALAQQQQQQNQTSIPHNAKDTNPIRLSYSKMPVTV